MSKKLFLRHDDLTRDANWFARKVFDKVRAAGLLIGINGEPAQGFDYNSFALYDNTLSLQGCKYLWGGERDYFHFTLPLDRVDDLDAYIAERKAEIAAKAAQKKLERENEKNKRDEIDRREYERLKKKFG